MVIGFLQTSSLLFLVLKLVSCPSSNAPSGPSRPMPSQGPSAPILNLDVKPSATNIAAGHGFLCGIKPSDNKIVCRGDITKYWDAAQGKELPSPDYEQAKTIEAIALSAGSNSACAIRRDNEKLLCFGTIHLRPRAGVVEEKRMDFFTIPDDAISDVAVGNAHVCAIRKDDHKIFCFGDNSRGQLTNIPTVPVQAIAAGVTHTCAISFENKALCFGSNYHGESNPPATPIKALALGAGFTCVIDHDDKPFCFGEAQHIQNVPPFEITHMVSKEWQTCGLKKADSTTICWGTYGNGSNSFENTPPPPEQFTKIVLGRFFMCGIKPDETFNCWGSVGLNPMATFKETLERL